MGKFLRTYNGLLVTKNGAAPTIEDIAVMQGRICRFNGATSKYWPVLLHSLAVADCFEDPYLIACALLHDSAEVIVGDTPCTMKGWYHDCIEKKYLKNIYKSLGVPWPTKKQRAIIKEADNKIGWAECYLVGPVNIEYDFPDGKIPRNKEAEGIVCRYLGYEFDEVLCPSGLFVNRYITRLKEALAELDKSAANK